MLGINSYEMVIIGIIALLLFGKRLPEVARSLGKGIMEFKKGMSGVEEEFRTASRAAESPSVPPARPAIDSDERKWEAPRFDPPTSAPRMEQEESAHAS